MKKLLLVSLMLVSAFCAFAQDITGLWEVSATETIILKEIEFQYGNIASFIYKDGSVRSYRYEFHEVYIVIGSLGYYWYQTSQNTIMLVPAFGEGELIVLLTKKER